MSRDSIEYDVVIVGAGPAGLSAAIRIRQLDPSLSVVVLEKGARVGAHVLSGAILDPVGLEQLFADWQHKGAPVRVRVCDDRLYLLGEAGKFRVPGWMKPPFMGNGGAYIVSMGQLCRWLAEQAEGLGVEIFASMACSEPVYGSQGELRGVVAGEFGRNREGEPTSGYEPGMEVCGRYVVIAEGARGSLSGELISRYGLSGGREPQKFALGIKEIWEVDSDRHRPGTVVHTLGWPLGSAAGGGGFVYHADAGQVYVGLVVHLDYANPYLSPYMEFQRFKHHPEVASVLTQGRRIAYGARVISGGGYQSLPRMAFPGGVLVGCAAGMVNVPRIKGNHNAMLSGIAAADELVEAMGSGRSGDVLTGYDTRVVSGSIGRELRLVRNVKPLWSRLGMFPGLALGGLDMWFQEITGGFSLFGSMGHGGTDAEAMRPASDFAPLSYGIPDGQLSFDRATSVSYSMLGYTEGQPGHLCLSDPDIPVREGLPRYGEPSRLYCPAGVYEIVEDAGGISRFVINHGNCIHCKTCDIKDPFGNITWRPPQGGDGPDYPNM